MSSQCTRILAPSVALALALGGCNACPSRVPPACPEPALAPGEIAPGSEIWHAASDPAAIAAAVADLRFVVNAGATLAAVADERSAPLPVDNVSSLGEARWSDDGSQVEVPYESTCGLRERATFSARTLVAHLQSAEALAAYRAGRVAEAAAGFARVAVLDPDLDQSYMYLASALAAAGEVDQAAAVLQLLVPRNPVRFYVEAMLDPDLAPLRELPAIAALRSPTPGTATIDETEIAGWLDALVGIVPAHGPTRRYIAVRHSIQGFAGNAVQSVLQIFDAATGELRIELPLASQEDSACDAPYGLQCDVLPGARARVTKRVEAANRVLRDLGFMREFEAREGASYDKQVTGAGNIFSIDFPDDRLRLGVAHGRAWVARVAAAPDRGREFGSDRAPVQVLIERATLFIDPSDIWLAQYLPEVNAVVFSWRPVFKCGIDGRSAVIVLPLSSSHT
jgi:hypothetical protein